MRVKIIRQSPSPSPPPSLSPISISIPIPFPISIPIIEEANVTPPPKPRRELSKASRLPKGYSSRMRKPWKPEYKAKFLHPECYPGNDTHRGINIRITNSSMLCVCVCVLQRKLHRHPSTAVKIVLIHLCFDCPSKSSRMYCVPLHSMALNQTPSCDGCVHATGNSRV